MTAKRNISDDNTSHDKIMTTASNFVVPVVRSKVEAWNLLKLRQPKQILFYKQFALKIAASLTILVIVTLASIHFSTVTISTAKGQHQSILLPDNSSVVLNAASSLSYNRVLWNTNRKVKLNGEGFFEVERGEKFQVITDHGTVEVLGTSFNVLARNNAFDVSCTSGKVQVSNNTSAVLLTKGLQTKKTTNGFIKPKAINEKTLSWRDGEFYFENSSLAEVVAELERQYNIQIQVEVNQERRYTGYFNNIDVNEALKLVCVPLALNYEMNGNKVKITSKKANV